LKVSGIRLLLINLQQKISSLLNNAIEPNMAVPLVMAGIGFLGSSRILPEDGPLTASIASQFGENLLFSLAVSLYVYIPLALLTYLRIRFRGSLDGALFFFLALLVSTSVTFFLAQISFRTNPEFAFANAVKLLVVTFLVSLITGQYRKLLAAELIQSMGLLAQSERQRRLLIQEDERVRREIADFLHNSIQSKLVVAGSKLKLIQSETPDPLASELKNLIGDLENIRSLDVRNASRALSPDIKNVGLKQSLIELASLYTNTMKVTFEFSELSDETESIYGLAIYRICEQGFLNALTHGAAENCVVRLSVEDSWVHLTIENDGAGVQGAGRSARGSAVIDAWVSSFDGTWTLRNLEIPGNTSAGTVRLEAKLKLDARLSNPMDNGLSKNPSLNAIATGPSKPGFVSN